MFSWEVRSTMPLGSVLHREDLTRFHCTLVPCPSKNPFILLIPQLGKLCNTANTASSKASSDKSSYFGTSSRKLYDLFRLLIVFLEVPNISAIFLREKPYSSSTALKFPLEYLELAYLLTLDKLVGSAFYYYYHRFFGINCHMRWLVVE